MKKKHFHGIFPKKNLFTYYILNLTIKADIWKAAETDDLKDTINYAEINNIIFNK